MNKIILIVDDDEPLRSSLCESFEYEGYTAVGMPNGRAALDYLRTSLSEPCMILLDLMMPVMNGWQFREEQLRDPGLSKIPVVVITANGTVDRSQLDVTDVLHKPVSLSALLDMTNRYCAC